MKCATCKKNQSVPTKWEKIKRYLVYHIFPLDIKEERGDAYTQGFSEGYHKGREHERELNSLAFNVQHYKEDIKKQVDDIV